MLTGGYIITALVLGVGGGSIVTIGVVVVRTWRLGRLMESGKQQQKTRINKPKKIYLKGSASYSPISFDETSNLIEYIVFSHSIYATHLF